MSALCVQERTSACHYMHSHLKHMAHNSNEPHYHPASSSQPNFRLYFALYLTAHFLRCEVIFSLRMKTHIYIMILS